MKTKPAAEQKNTAPAPQAKKKCRLWRFLIGLTLFLGILISFVYIYMNVSFWSDKEFARRLDASIAQARVWTEQHKEDIQKRKNVALMRMLQDSDCLHHDPLYAEIVNSFYSDKHLRPDCWKRLLDKDYFVSSYELNPLIDKEGIDNKWILYAIAKEKAQVDPDVIDGLFDPLRWRSRQLTHQLWALIHLRQRQGSDAKTEQVISTICDRLEGQMKWTLPVTDIFIQKIAFMLFSGNDRRINRRWVERVIDNQRSDGGWNDRWCLFFESRRCPAFDFQPPPAISMLPSKPFGCFIRSNTDTHRRSAWPHRKIKFDNRIVIYISAVLK